MQKQSQNSTDVSLKQINNIKNSPYQNSSDKKQLQSYDNISTNPDIEHPKLNLSSYKLFLEEWQKSKPYPLPQAFKHLQITDKSQNAIKNQYQWFNFSILSYSNKQLCQVATKIILHSNFQTIVKPELLIQVIQQICLRYKPVSYHNFSHGFSLMHMFFQLTQLDTNFKKMYTFQEIGYCLIAALAHDLSHPGTNNAYEVKIKSKHAEKANNEAVLQKMHIQQFFSLLKQNNFEIFAKSTNSQKMKQLIIQVILATDVSAHFKNLQKLKKMLPLKTTETQNNQNRYFYMEQAFHACDIGNPCLEMQQYMNWASLLTYQFNSQTIMQEKNNVQVTQMLKFKNMKSFYQGQAGFINFLVVPLWKELSSAWPGFSLLLQNIQTNLKLLKIKSQKQKND